jgi:hypothetical protein
MWVIASFRDYSVGVDTLRYKQSFDAVGLEGSFPDVDWLKLFAVDGFESGYRIYTFLATLVSDNFTVFLAITHAIILFLTWRAIKKHSVDYYVSFIIYFSFLFLGSMNHFRQAIAIAITSLGIDSLFQRKPVKYFAIVALATLFHQSAIIMAPVYFMYGVRFSMRGVVLFLLGGVSLFALINPIVVRLASDNFRYETYLGSLDSYQLGSVLITCLLAVIAGVSIYIARTVDFSKLKVGASKKLQFYLYVLVGAFILSLVSIRFSGFSRSATYLMAIVMIGLPYIISLANVRNENLQKIIITVVFVGYAFTLLILRPEWLGVAEYSFYLME